MSLPQVARRYAQALYVTAEEAGELLQAAAELRAVARLLEEAPSIAGWCREGQVHGSTAVEFVRTAFGPVVGRLTGRTLLLAAANGRLAAIPLLPPAFEAESAARSATVPVTLETAQPADAELLDLVRTHVAERTGRSVEIRAVTDPSLVGGFRAFWQSRLWDGSARGRLTALRRQLTTGGSP